MLIFMFKQLLQLLYFKTDNENLGKIQKVIF